MCAIAGAVALSDALAPAAADAVARMSARMAARGPDGAGLARLSDGAAVFAHRRLAIIDPSPAAAQPMTDATGRWTLVFNGEIYNYVELRAELAAAGRRPVGAGDVGTLLACIAEWGEAGLARLRGMYAFALWDAREQELWLCRDPFGIKPLYYAQAGDALFFASQARALAVCAPIPPARDPAGLVGFAVWGFTPEPFTWWRGVSALPAGGVLRLRRGGAPRLSADDALARARALPPRPIGRDELDAALLDSVRAHYVADVPVGLFLSAGVDSTTLAALAARSGQRLVTLTLSFDSYAAGERDEAALAGATARALGANHIAGRIAARDFAEAREAILAAMDQPTTDGVNVWFIARAARAAGLKAALSGLGADELFGGYPSFRDAPRLAALGALLPARRTLAGLSRRLGAASSGRGRKATLALAYAGSLEASYALRRALTPVEDLAEFFEAGVIAEGLERLARETPAFYPPFPAPPQTTRRPHARVSDLELDVYMRNQLLRDADWAGMAHGVEIRTPFVDLPLYRALAPAIASPHPPTKRDLAQFAAAGAPAPLAAKQGFAPPLRQWTRGDAAPRAGLRGWAADVMRHFG